MRKSDIWACLILGEIVAVFLYFVLKNISFTIFPAWIVFFILPILALIAVYIAYLIGRKIFIVFQFAKYATVGFANTAVDFGILNLLMWATGIYSGKMIIVLNSLAFLLAVIHSYLWNKFWAFKTRGRGGVSGQFLQFLAVTIVGILINGAIVYIISTWVTPMFDLSDVAWANAAKVVATVVSLIWNFIGYKFIVFRKKK